jgi:5,6-dimethylbenzimidazole synthase
VTGRFPDADREAFERLLRSRRDIRRFLGTPIDPAILRRVLELAHLAPSVGLSQPWRFLLIESIGTRSRIKSLFEAKNAEESSRIADPARRELYDRLKLEGIVEAPLNIAVLCDRRRSEPFTLGHAPMPATDLYSTCLAIQNLWLAARTEGLGVGWVSILDAAEVEAILGVPADVRLVAYLCVGYPLEFRDVPMLEEVGWKSRVPVEDLVFREHWGQRE